MIELQTLADVLFVLGLSGLGFSGILWILVELLDQSIKKQEKEAGEETRKIPKKLVRQLKKAYAQADVEQAEQIRKTIQDLIVEVNGKKN